MFGRAFLFVGAYEIGVTVLALLLGLYSFIYLPEALVGIIRFNAEEIVPILVGLFPEARRAQAEIGASFFNAERWLILSEIALGVKLISIGLRYVASRLTHKNDRGAPGGKT